MQNTGFSVENVSQRVTEDVASSLSFECLIDGLIPTVTSCTVTITDRNDNALSTAVSAEDATVSGNKCSYALTAAQLPDTDRKYKAVWLPIIGGVTYRFVHYFDVTYKDVPIMISDRDIIAENRLLGYDDEQYTIRGTATGGTTSTLIDANELKGFYDDDFFNGCVLRIIDGTAVGERRKITDYVDSTGTVTVSPVLSGSPDTTSEYCIYTYQLAINSAVEELQSDLKDAGYNYFYISDNVQIKRLQLIYACRKILLGKMKEEGDQFYLQYLEYNRIAKEKLQSLTIDYDAMDDGEVSNEDEATSIYGQVTWGQ